MAQNTWYTGKNPTTSNKWSVRFVCSFGGWWLNSHNLRFWPFHAFPGSRKNVCWIPTSESHFQEMRGTFFMRVLWIGRAVKLPTDSPLSTEKSIFWRWNDICYDSNERMSGTKCFFQEIKSIVCRWPDPLTYRRLLSRWKISSKKYSSIENGRVEKMRNQKIIFVAESHFEVLSILSSRVRLDGENIMRKRLFSTWCIMGATRIIRRNMDVMRVFRQYRTQPRIFCFMNEKLFFCSCYSHRVHSVQRNWDLRSK